MTNPNGPIKPDWTRVTRAFERRLGRTVPADGTPVQNGNEVVNKVAVTMNRAGSGLANPVCLGLGVEFQFRLRSNDRLTGVWVYQDPNDLGANLLATVSMLAPGAFSFYVRAGSELESGAHDGEAVRNFIRVKSRFGTFEKEMWCKDYSAAVVQLAGHNALDLNTFEPVARTVQIQDDTADWIEIPVDFFCDWSDEFQTLHKRTDGDVTSGFLKAYGGAKFVSFFDTGEDEGTGVQVQAVTQEAIEQRHTVRVQNTAGDKLFTARFRSKADSDFFVDVPLLVTVEEPPVHSCVSPQVLPCSDVYLKNGTLLPADSPAVPSVPGVQVVAGVPGSVVSGDLLVVTLKGASTASSPNVRVQKWRYVTSTPALAGNRVAQVGDDEVYLPLRQSALSPDPGLPYLSPKRLTIAFSVVQLRSDNVAFLTLEVEDEDFSTPVLVLGPRARDIMFTPPGGTGGGPICAY